MEHLHLPQKLWAAILVISLIDYVVAALLNYLYYKYYYYGASLSIINQLVLVEC